MQPERWQQVERIYHEALQRPEGERCSFVLQACAGDSSLQAEVESLLQYAGSPSAVLDAPALDVVAHQLARSLQAENQARSSSLINATIGQYRVIAKIGAGGMGEVYRAHDASLGRDVAIKILPSFFSADPERLRRFEQEARAAAALSHPNILAVFQMGAYDGAPYLVSELLEGETLRDQIKRGRLPARKAIDYGVQIAHGLAAAHEKGIVHRDLKPENLFVKKDGRIKILDFGLAKLTQPRLASDPDPASSNEPTERGLVMGTAGYMAPEQVRGETADHRADIFAFGAILYEMLSGKRAFQKPTAAETMSAIVNEDPASISDISTSIAPGLQRVVHRCMEKNPEPRFQSASDLAFALDALSDSGYGSSADIKRAVPRLSATSALAITGIFVMGAAFALWWSTPLPEPKIVQVFPVTTTARQDYMVRPATDGARIFYVERNGDHYDLMQVPVTGGDSRRMDAPFRNTLIWDVSPDNSHYLITSFAHRGEPSQLWSWPVTGSSPLKLGDLVSGSATYSPDGRLIAFHIDKDLWVANADGTGRRKLGTFPGDVDDPAWSPDGSRIRFTLKDADRTTSSIWEIQLDGSGLRAVLPDWPNPSYTCCGTWSLDGRYFFFIDQRDKPQLWVLREKSDWLRRSPRGPFLLVSGANGSRSPLVGRDGQHVYFYNLAFETDLHSFDASTNQFSGVLTAMHPIMPSFSRDGQWMAYVRAIPGGGLWRSKTDGSDLIPLPFPGMSVGFPRWSPDGKTLAFSASGSGLAENVYVVEADGGRPSPLVPGQEELADPDWSPDGSMLVVREHLAIKGESGTPALEFVTMSDRSTREVPGSRGLEQPRWSPDGKWIAALSEHRDQMRLYNVSRNEWRTVVQGRAFGLPVWSKDSAAIYYQEFGESGEPLRRIVLTTGASETITDFQKVHEAGVAHCIFVALTPTGLPLINFDHSNDIYGATLSLP